jgi:uncharacterized membrane protein
MTGVRRRCGTGRMRCPPITPGVPRPMPFSRYDVRQHGVSARRRVAMASAVGLLAGLLSALVIPWYLAPLVGWDVAAMTYVSRVWMHLWRLDARQTARHAEREDPTRATYDGLLIAAAVASLVGVGTLILHAGPSGEFMEGLRAGFAIASVILSWSVVHTVFALRYARIYYEGEDGGADFHQEDEPQYSDFAYLSFTIGMTFQVSDTELRTAAFRATVLRHALLSYLFGTIIVALTINLVAGLTH